LSFNQINIPLLTLSLLPCSHNIQQLKVHYIILFSYIDKLFQYFSFSNIFISSPTSHCPFRQTHYIYI
jgi:hypothetical protein